MELESEMGFSQESGDLAVHNTLYYAIFSILLVAWEVTEHGTSIFDSWYTTALYTF
jgi:hypothetical protein